MTTRYNTIGAEFKVTFSVEDLPREDQLCLLKNLMGRVGLERIIFEKMKADEDFAHAIDLAWENFRRVQS